MSRDLSTEGRRQAPLAALRGLVRRRPAAERCELCSLELAPEHQHLLRPANGQLLCCCDACAILFSDRHGAGYQRVPRRIRVLADFHMTDAQWEALHVPIDLAFFVDSTRSERVVALYPSPAGSTESLLTLEAWQDLVEENPSLRDLEADVEALLVNRVGQSREYYRVPIDECYRLVGLLRTHWRGLSGGREAWEAIGQFFARLRERAGVPGADAHA